MNLLEEFKKLNKKEKREFINLIIDEVNEDLKKDYEKRELEREQDKDNVENKYTLHALVQIKRLDTEDI